LADESGKTPWYFGVFCEQCAAFIPVRRDDTDGWPGARLATSGTIIAVCHTCRHRGRYAVNRVEQRRAEPRAPIRSDTD